MLLLIADILKLNYYTLYSQNNNKEDATKLKSKLELKRAKLIDDNDIENRKYEVQKNGIRKNANSRTNER